MGLLTGVLNQSVSLAAPGTPTGGWSGTGTPGSSTAYPARVEFKLRRVVGPDRIDRLSSGRVIIEGDITVTTDYILTLPSGMAPQTPPILSIEKNPDHFGVILTTVLYF